LWRNASPVGLAEMAEMAPDLSRWHHVEGNWYKAEEWCGENTGETTDLAIWIK